MKKFLFTSVMLLLGAGNFAVACSDQVCNSAVEVPQQVAAPTLAVESLAVPNVAVLAAPAVVTPTVLAAPTVVTPAFVTPNVVVNQVVRQRSRPHVQVTRVRTR